MKSGLYHIPLISETQIALAISYGQIILLSESPNEVDLQVPESASKSDDILMILDGVLPVRVTVNRITTPRAVWAL